jgi:hypothetical protein
VPAVRPASTVRVCPVIQRAQSEALAAIAHAAEADGERHHVAMCAVVNEGHLRDNPTD